MSAERDLNFVVEPSEEYHCPICAKVLVEPHVTDCCGQHFCEECLKKWFEEQLGKMICPHCRSEEFTHIRYLPLKRKINELLVYCSNRENGCTEVICVCQLESHFNQCLYTTVMCSNNCGTSLLRKDLTDHLSDKCVMRLSVCIYCQKQDRHFVIVSLQHQQRCPDFPIGCPKSCSGGDQVKRKDLHAHSLVCPLESVVCPDCQAEMLREQATEHGRNECPKRIVLCMFCQEQIRYDVTDTHLQECLEFPVECPRRCELGPMLLRKNLVLHRRECPLEPVTCSPCQIEVIRKDMSEHKLSKCPKRPTECKYCHKIGPYDDIMGQHMDKCEEFPVGCPRRCHGSEQLKRKNMRSHTEVCPLEPVQCPYNEVGCNPLLVRRDLNSHLKSNLENHMLKLMTAHTKLIAEHDKLWSDHTKLKNDCTKMKTELAETQAKHSEVAESLAKMTSSISLEMDIIGKGKVNDTSLRCIKTVLNPIMKNSKANLAFRVPPITQRWTSPLFYILDRYKMSLVLSKDDQQRSTTVSGLESAANSAKTNVSLQLLRGDNDNQLKWPTDSTLTLEISVTQNSKTLASSCPSTVAAKGRGRGAYSSSIIRRKHEFLSGQAAYATYSDQLRGWDREEVNVIDDDHSEYRDRYSDRARITRSRKSNNHLQLSLKLNQYLQQRIIRENSQELTQGSIDSPGPWTVMLSLSEPKRASNPERWHRHDIDDNDRYEEKYPYYDDD